MTRGYGLTGWVGRPQDGTGESGSTRIEKFNEFSLREPTAGSERLTGNPEVSPGRFVLRARGAGRAGKEQPQVLPLRVRMTA